MFTKVPIVFFSSIFVEISILVNQTIKYLTAISPCWFVQLDVFFSIQCSLHENLLWNPRLCSSGCLLQIRVHSVSVGWKIKAYWTASFSHVFLSHAWTHRLHWEWNECGRVHFFFPAEKHILMFYWAGNSSFVSTLDIRLLLRMICRPLREAEPRDRLPSTEWGVNITDIWNLTVSAPLGITWSL